MGHSPVNIEVFSCAKQKKFKVHTPFLEPIAASHGLRQGMLFAQGSCRFNLWHINTFNLLMKTTESSWKILWADFYFRFFDKPFLLLLLNISKVLPCYSTSTYQLFFLTFTHLHSEFVEKLNVLFWWRLSIDRDHNGTLSVKFIWVLITYH